MPFPTARSRVLLVGAVSGCSLAGPPDLAAGGAGAGSTSEAAGGSDGSGGSTGASGSSDGGFGGSGGVGGGPDAATTSSGPGSACDEAPLCTNEPGGCPTCATAEGGPCAKALAECTGAPDDACLGYLGCIQGCAGDAACAEACKAERPEGAALFDAPSHRRVVRPLHLTRRVMHARPHDATSSGSCL